MKKIKTRIESQMTSDQRQKGIAMLNTVMSSTKKCKKLEKEIYAHNPDPEFYFWALYQCVGMTMKGFSATSLVKEGKVGWESPCYDSYAKVLQEHDDYIVHPFDVVDGVTICPKCKSGKTWSVQKQTRSSDEPMTTFSRCVMCNHTWRYSG